MPTDLAAVYAQKRRVQAQTQADFEVVLIFRRLSDRVALVYRPLPRPCA